MKKTASPWTAERVDSETNGKLLEKFHGERDGYVKIGPKKYFFPLAFGERGQKYYDFEPRSDDTWIVTFPRSGTTMTQELIWIIGNDFNYDTASEVPLVDRFPFFEFGENCNPTVRKEFIENARDEIRDSVKAATACVLPNLEAMAEKRFIKTHLPFSLLNPNLVKCGAKVIYVARNPKDVIISYYHLHRLFKTLDFVGTFDEFWEFFKNDMIMWCPYWEHINEGWQLRNEPNVLFLFYEEIQQNMTDAIHRISTFLGKTCSAEQANTLAKHMDITNFKKNPSVNMDALQGMGILNSGAPSFVRKGGGGTSELTNEQEEKIKAWTEENMRGVEFRFPEVTKRN